MSGLFLRTGGIGLLGSFHAKRPGMDDENKRAQKVFAGAVRQGDVEPYTALRWLGTLFKSAAVFLFVAIIGEFVAGMRYEGMRASTRLPTDAGFIQHTPTPGAHPT